MSLLVIDDDSDVRRSIGNYLTARGHRVYLAAGGAEGLEVLRREVVDIVITDVKMPDMDGFEVLREARRISPGTEVIVITAYGDVESAVRATDLRGFLRDAPAADLDLSLIEKEVIQEALRRCGGSRVQGRPGPRPLPRRPPPADDPARLEFVSFVILPHPLRIFAHPRAYSRTTPLLVRVFAYSPLSCLFRSIP